MSDHFGKISIQQPVSPDLPPTGRPSKKTRPPSPRKYDGKKSRSGGRSLLWFLIIVLFFTLYNVAGFVGVPYYVSTLLPKTIFTKTGLIFQAGAVKFNPLTFVFGLENIKILPADRGQHDLLKIKSIRGRLTPLALLRNNLVSDSLTIEEIEAHITRETDGSYFFSSFFDASLQDKSADMMDFSELPFQFSLNNIAVSRSKIIFSDLPLNTTHRIEDIQFALPTFSNFPFQAGNYIQPHFSATIDGSPVELTGSASVGEGGDGEHATDLSCDIRALNLSHYFAYLPFQLPFNLGEGKTDGKIGLTFDPDGEKGKKLAITFDLRINNTALSTHTDSVKIAAPVTTLAGTLHPVSKYLNINTIAMRDPVFSSFGKNFTTNLRDIFSADSSSAPTKGQAASSLTVGIDQVIVDGGSLQLFNANDSDKPHTSWNSIEFSLKDYTSAAYKGKVKNFGMFRLTAEQSGSSSTFSWQGELTAPQFLDGSLSINNIQTPKFFEAIGLEPFIASKGLADLQGKFRLNLSAGTSSSPAWQLTDTSISVQNFSLLDNKTPFLAAPILTLSGFSSTDGQTDFGSISIDNGTLNLSRGVLPEALSLFARNTYQLQSLNFDGKATLSANRKNGSKIHFPTVSLKAKDLNLGEKAKNNISMNAQGENGGSLEAAGSVFLSPFKAALKTEFSRLQSNSVFSFFTDSPFLTSMQGSIEGKGSVTLPDIGFIGQLSLDQASVSLENNPVISWTKSTLQDINFSSKPFHLGIVSVELDSPRFSWEISARDNSPMESFRDFLQKNIFLSNGQKQSKKNVTISPFDVQEVSITNGRIQVKETRMSPAWQGSITDLSGRITDIHSAETSTNSQFQLSGKLDDSPFSVEGQSDFFSKEKNGSFSFNLADVPIADFHDQLSPRLDIDTSKGTLSISQNSQWEDGSLSCSGTISLTDIEPGSQAPETTLLLALLTDQGNTFHLDYSSTEQEPTSQSPLFDHAVTQFQKLIVKTSVSPLLVANGDFTDLIGNEFVEFRPGEAVMTEKGDKILARYSALLDANPNIGLSLSGHYHTSDDAEALKKQAETAESERVVVENRSRFQEWQAQKDAYAQELGQKREKAIREGRIVEQDIPPKFLQEFIPSLPQPVTVNEDMLKDLADKRVTAAFQYFLNQLTLDSERIIIEGSKHPSAAGDDGSASVSIRITPLR